jgi:GlpG protein
LRQIGVLTVEDAARHLADHLLTLGVKTQLRPESAGWGLWVLDEDRLDVARKEFEAFRTNPDDPRFQAAAQQASTIRRELDRRDKEYRKNFRYVSDAWSGPNIRRRPLTFTLIVACVAVYLLKELPGMGAFVNNTLTFSGVHVAKVGDELLLRRGGFEDITRGQVWRLVTPIFLHFGPLHLLFNLWALAFFGTMIEYRRSTGTLVLLVLLSAVASNLGEACYQLSITGQSGTFGGMSGVVYALFGYVWMKGLYEPEQGMILHPSTVQFMLLFLLLCMTGLMGGVANAAHVVGVVTGVVLGLARL